MSKDPRVHPSFSTTADLEESVQKLSLLVICVLTLAPGEKENPSSIPETGEAGREASPMYLRSCLDCKLTMLGSSNLKHTLVFHKGCLLQRKLCSCFWVLVTASHFAALSVVAKEPASVLHRVQPAVQCAWVWSRYTNTWVFYQDFIVCNRRVSHSIH